MNTFALVLLLGSAGTEHYEWTLRDNLTAAECRLAINLIPQDILLTTIGPEVDGGRAYLTVMEHDDLPWSIVCVAGASA